MDWDSYEGNASFLYAAAPAKPARRQQRHAAHQKFPGARFRHGPQSQVGEFRVGKRFNEEISGTKIQTGVRSCLVEHQDQVMGARYNNLEKQRINTKEIAALAGVAQPVGGLVEGIVRIQIR